MQILMVRIERGKEGVVHVCHDHMCAMVVSSAYLGFPGLGLEESGSSGRMHLHVANGGIV
jgi:hypothetical protein